MRTQNFTFPLLLIIIVFLASCGSNRSFSSRKYMAGNYTSHKHKPGKVKELENPNQDTEQTAQTEKTMTDAKTEEQKHVDDKTEYATGDKTVSGMMPVEGTTSSSASKKSTVAEKTTTTKAEAIKGMVMRKFMGNSMERKCLAYDDDGGGTLDSVALVSFILGILGLLVNILALSVIVSTSEYIFTLMFIAGMVMGIIAVVFGTQGIRRNRKTKNGSMNLVFSIVGTSLGGAAIITAFIFAFYTLIFFLESL